jgi:hypothetical protein
VSEVDTVGVTHGSQLIVPISQPILPLADISACSTHTSLTCKPSNALHSTAEPCVPPQRRQRGGMAITPHLAVMGDNTTLGIRDWACKFDGSAFVGRVLACMRLLLRSRA